MLDPDDQQYSQQSSCLVKKKTIVLRRQSSMTDAEREDVEASAAAFASLGVCRELSEVAARLGWKRPMPIQMEAIPKLLAGWLHKSHIPTPHQPTCTCCAGQDVIGLAQTGSGKTGAFALPILQDLLDVQKPFFALVMAPTRELAVQIAEQFEALGSGIGVRCAVLVGGVDMMQQSVAIGKQPHIIVGTPGRIVDHLSHTKVHQRAASPSHKAVCLAGVQCPDG